MQITILEKNIRQSFYVFKITKYLRSFKSVNSKQLQKRWNEITIVNISLSNVDFYEK